MKPLVLLVLISAGCDGLFRDGQACGFGYNAKCPNGYRCFDDGHCESGWCLKQPAGDGGLALAGTCTERSCLDGIKNGRETDTDCGGFCVLRCGLDKGCAAGEDCETKNCVAGRCKPTPSCADGVQNREETGIDCGGPACIGCPERGPCQRGADCLSLVCEKGVCQKNTCSDSVKNGSETDVDCGPRCPMRCAEGRACDSDPDCASRRCVILSKGDAGIIGVCVAPVDAGVRDGANGG